MFNRGQVVDAMMSEDEGMKLPETGEVSLDLSLFPELQNKKEGETATVTVKIKAIAGRNVIVVPGEIEAEEPVIKPGTESYQEKPTLGEV